MTQKIIFCLPLPFTSSAAEVVIPDRCVVRFRPSKELKDRAAAIPIHKMNGDKP